MKNFILSSILVITSCVLIITSIHFISNPIKTKTASYSINHYIDTINGHIILSTVYNYSDNISISTLELNNNDSTNIK